MRRESVVLEKGDGWKIGTGGGIFEGRGVNQKRQERKGVSLAGNSPFLKA